MKTQNRMPQETTTNKINDLKVYFNCIKNSTDQLLVNFSELVEIVFKEADLLLLSQRSSSIFGFLATQRFLNARLKILHEEFAQIV